MMDASNSGLPATSIVAVMEPTGVTSSLRNPPADQLQNSAAAKRDVLAPAPSEPQSAQSAAPAPVPHPYGPSRPRQHHHQARSSVARTNRQLVPR